MNALSTFLFERDQEKEEAHDQRHKERQALKKETIDSYASMMEKLIEKL